MKRLLFPFVGLLTFALFSSTATEAQNCGLAMQPEYYDYVSASVSGNTIYTTVQILGYTQVQIEPGCTLNGVTHTGKVYNQIATVGGWTTGPAVWPPNSINVSSNQSFTGTAGTTYPFNWTAEVICSMIGTFYDSGSAQITMVSATISQRSTGAVSADNAAQSYYQTAEGTTNLGLIIATGQLQGCFIGYETIGTVTPNTYTGNVVLHRTIVSDATYTNTTSTGGAAAGSDDTSLSASRDDDPQSGGSGGKVYDLDSPGENKIPADGKVYRGRTNFYMYATLAGQTTAISPNYYFFVRSSCKNTGSGYQFVNDIPTDNQIGSGSTKTTWNLQ